MADQTGLEKTAGQLWWWKEQKDRLVGELGTPKRPSGRLLEVRVFAVRILVLSYALSGNTLRPLRSFDAPESAGLAPRSVLSPARNQEPHHLIYHGVRLSEAVISYDWQCKKQVEPALCAATGRATLSPRGALEPDWGEHAP